MFTERTSWKRSNILFHITVNVENNLLYYLRDVPGASKRKKKERKKWTAQSGEAWTWKCLRKQSRFCSFSSHWLVYQRDDYNNEVGRKNSSIHLILVPVAVGHFSPLFMNINSRQTESWCCNLCKTGLFSFLHFLIIICLLSFSWQTLPE